MGGDSICKTSLYTPPHGLPPRQAHRTTYSLSREASKHQFPRLRPRVVVPLGYRTSLYPALLFDTSHLLPSHSIYACRPPYFSSLSLSYSYVTSVRVISHLSQVMRIEQASNKVCSRIAAANCPLVSSLLLLFTPGRRQPCARDATPTRRIVVY